MSKPKRIQRQRIKGWRMPAGAVYVGRPTKWGNPHPVGGETTAHDARELYRLWLTTIGTVGPDDARRELSGRDLACWCPLDQPCHADVLLEIANTTQEPQ